MDASPSWTSTENLTEGKERAGETPDTCDLAKGEAVERHHCKYTQFHETGRLEDARIS
jgi:hypothetical protein